MSELPTSPEHHPLRPTLEGAAQTTLTMDRLPGDLWALLSKGTQRLAQQDTGSFCFHPLHPLRPGFTCLRKLLTQLPNPACRAECASIHLGNPGQDDRPCDGRAGPHG